MKKVHTGNKSSQGTEAMLGKSRELTTPPEPPNNQSSGLTDFSLIKSDTLFTFRLVRPLNGVTNWLLV